MDKRRKRILIGIFLVLVLVAAGLGGYKLHRMKQVKQSGILLAFDDYNEDSWTKGMDLMDKYDAKATFFVTCAEPTDFCIEAQKRGYEIGYHTLGHQKVTEMTPEEIEEKCIMPIETFHEKGIDMTTFAYPAGAYTEELNALLLQHYKVVRGAYFYEVHGKGDLKDGFVESMSIDNVNYESDEIFREKIDSIMTELSENEGAVASIYSHAIAGGDWCIQEDRLEYVLQKAKEKGLEFYTFRELQQF